MAIGQQLGLADEPRVLSGSELDQLSDDELAQQIGRLDILARATPSHKLRLIAALQAAGHITAMTGDGVNDAPALKTRRYRRGDGRQGTEAAKEAASMVLADDNFATLRDAVSEGRTIYENLRKALVFLYPPTSSGSGAAERDCAGHRPAHHPRCRSSGSNGQRHHPLAAAAFEQQPDGDLMRRPPRQIGEPILPLALWLLIIGSAILMSA
jgi:hypothetical protein